MALKIRKRKPKYTNSYVVKSKFQVFKKILEASHYDEVTVEVPFISSIHAERFYNLMVEKTPCCEMELKEALVKDAPLLKALSGIEIWPEVQKISHHIGNSSYLGVSDVYFYDNNGTEHEVEII